MGIGVFKSVDDLFEPFLCIRDNKADKALELFEKYAAQCEYLKVTNNFDGIDAMILQSYQLGAVLTYLLKKDKTSAAKCLVNIDSRHPLRSHVSAMIENHSLNNIQQMNLEIVRFTGKVCNIQLG